MEHREILEKLKNIIANQFDIDKKIIKEEATFVDDLEADSLDIVELIMNIEEEFNIQIPDADTEKIVTVGDVVDYIKENN